MTLKRTIAILLSATLLCTVFVANVCGQVTVTGHITAEVIESVHASSTVVTGFDLKNEQLHQQVESWKSEAINIGAITVNAGESMACNIKLDEATLSDSKGNCFTIEPTTLTSGLRIRCGQTAPKPSV